MQLPQMQHNIRRALFCPSDHGNEQLREWRLGLFLVSALGFGVLQGNRIGDHKNSICSRSVCTPCASLRIRKEKADSFLYYATASILALQTRSPERRRTLKFRATE
jgi:hypothetical protein